MLTLVSTLFLAAAGGPTTSIGDVFFTHAGGGRDPVDFTVRPPKVPECRTDEEIRKALADKDKGDEPSCILPKVVPAADPRR